MKLLRIKFEVIFALLLALTTGLLIWFTIVIENNWKMWLLVIAFAVMTVYTYYTLKIVRKELIKLYK